MIKDKDKNILKHIEVGGNLVFTVFEEKEKYLKAKSEEELTLENKIILLLEKLGYSIDELGTYYIRDVIIRMMEILKSENFELLIQQLVNPFSQFYFDIARNDKDIGVKTLHAFIMRAHEKILSNQLDLNLVELIFGDKREHLDYKEEIYFIAKYIYKISYRLEQVEFPVILQLQYVN